MTTVRCAILIFSLVLGGELQAAHVADDKFGLVDAVTEIMVLRPAGLIGTILGAGFYVATTPLIALANVAPPHDAFEKTFDVFVVAPADYTFSRPLGVYHKDAHGVYRRTGWEDDESMPR